MRLCWWRRLVWGLVDALLRALAALGLLTCAESDLYSLRCKSALARRPAPAHSEPSAPRTLAQSTSTQPSRAPASIARSDAPVRRIRHRSGHLGLVDSDEEEDAPPAPAVHCASPLSPYCLKGARLSRESTHEDSFFRAMAEALSPVRDQDEQDEDEEDDDEEEEEEERGFGGLRRTELLPRAPPPRRALADPAAAVAPLLEKMRLFDEARERVQSERAHDTHAYYEQLLRAETSRRATSLREATVKEATARLTVALGEELVDVQSLRAALEAADGLAEASLCAEAGALLAGAGDLLRGVREGLARFKGSGGKADEAALEGLLQSALGRRLRLSGECVDARDFLFLHPALAQEEEESAPPSGAQEAGGLVLFDLSHVRQAQERVRWLARLEQGFADPSIDAARQGVAVMLERAVAELCPPTPDGAPTVDGALRAVHLTSSLLAAPEVSDRALVFALHALVDRLVRAAAATGHSLLPDAVALALQGVHHGLGQSLRSVFASLLLPSLNRADPRCIPDLAHATDSSALAALLGSLVETGAIPTFDARFGWRWITRASKQLFRLVRSADAELVDSSCRFVRAFLDRCHLRLRRECGARFAQLARELSGLLKGVDGEAAAALSSLLRPICAGSVVSSTTLQGYPSHVFPLKIQIGSLRRFVENALLIESSTVASTRRLAESIGLDQLDGEFNKLGPSRESQMSVIAGIVGIANRAGTNTELVNYSLFRVSREIVSRSSSQFFSIAAGHALPLARLVCELCKVKRDLGDLIKAQFYLSSPLTMPCFEDGLRPLSDEYCLAMGFERLVDRSGIEGWESAEKWCARQMKIVVVFFTVLLQPEGYPLSLDDGYRWLLNAINAVRLSARPPFVAAALLDHVLRVASPALMKQYGHKYMDVLKVVHVEIVPLLESTAAKAKIELKRLLQFLTHALASKGKDFLSL